MDENNISMYKRLLKDSEYKILYRNATLPTTLSALLLAACGGGGGGGSEN